MRRFLHASDRAFAELESAAKAAAYLNFGNAELPPGSVPARSRIGLMVNPQSGATTLFAQRGTRYYGANDRIREWLQNGGVSFPSFGEFRRWITAVIQPEFQKGRELPTVVAATRETKSEPDAHPEQARGVTSSSADSGAMKRLLEFLVKHVAKNYEVDVCTIEAAVLEDLRDRVNTAKDETSCGTVADDLFGGPFALAAVEGHRHVSVHAGPPIACKPAVPKS